MLQYTLRRLLTVIPVLLVVLTVVFFVVRVIPGDPALAALGDQATEESLAAARERMGLDRPMAIQYLDYLAGILRGDLGNSLVTGQPAADVIFSVLPHTIQLTLCGILIGLLIGIPAGVWSAVRRDKPADYAGRLISLVGLSFPAFFIGVIVIYVFAVQLRWFPTGGAGDFGDPAENLRRLVLPALAVGIVCASFTSRVTRSVTIDALGQDFVRTARAKGITRWRALVRHAFRSGLVSIVSLVGVFMVSLLGSAVATEIVFARPGLGRVLVNAVNQRDYGLLQACAVVFAILVVIVNLVIDLSYGFVDPKARKR